MIEARGFPAEFQAMPACFHAFLHLTQTFAIFGADFADIRTQRTDAVVELALVREQVRGCRTDRGTVQHQPDVLRANMVSAELEAVRHDHGKAGCVAARQRVHAPMHLATEAVGYFRHHKGCNCRMRPSVPLRCDGQTFRFRAGVSRAGSARATARWRGNHPSSPASPPGLTGWEDSENVTNGEGQIRVL